MLYTSILLKALNTIKSDLRCFGAREYNLSDSVSRGHI